MPTRGTLLPYSLYHDVTTRVCLLLCVAGGHVVVSEAGAALTASAAEAPSADSAATATTDVTSSRQPRREVSDFIMSMTSF